jgi:hypothetical protein
MLQRFLEHVYDWLALSEPADSGAIIFALAGRQSRKQFALELFSRGLAPVLLLSVGRFEIRRFAQLRWPTPVDLLSIAAPLPAAQRHYFVSLESGQTTVARVERGKLGTLSEIRVLARWLQKRPAINSLLMVSSAPHLRRVRACCRALLPVGIQVHYVAVPNEEPLSRVNWWRDRHARRIVLREFPKLLGYRILLLMTPTVGDVTVERG